MAGGKSRGVSGGSSKKKKKGKPLLRAPARLAAVHATLLRWASVKPSSDPLLLRMDLHTHSTCSDGRLSPTDLVTRAHRNGVNVMALTDHDTMEGVPVALKVARELGIRLIPGVEISAKFASRPSKCFQTDTTRYFRDIFLFMQLTTTTGRGG